MLPSTSDLIKKYGLDAKKSLGQNFILDKNFTDKIARVAGDLTDFEVLEIGPGPGSLTRSILDAGAKKLTVIEKDERCLAALQELKNFYGERLEIVAGDALTIKELVILGSQSRGSQETYLPRSSALQAKDDGWGESSALRIKDDGCGKDGREKEIKNKKNTPPEILKK
jgi:hypothetical protein